MKSNHFLLISLFAVLACGSSCKEKTEYPNTGVIGERTLAGEIGLISNPPTTIPPLPGLVLGLKTATGDYILSYYGQWISDDKIDIDDEVYYIDDTVEITRTVSRTQISGSEEYYELEIKSIEK